MTEAQTLNVEREKRIKYAFSEADEARVLVTRSEKIDATAGEKLDAFLRRMKNQHGASSVLKFDSGKNKNLAIHTALPDPYKCSPRPLSMHQRHHKHCHSLYSWEEGEPGLRGGIAI